MVGTDNPADWMRKATAFELLSLFFLIPEKSIAEALVSGDFSAACEELLEVSETESALTVCSEMKRLLSEYEGTDAERVFHELRSEYTRLFVGEKTPLITPYVGVWAAEQRGQQALLFVGKDSMEIERIMHRCGVAKDLDAGQSNDPLDHFGTVCEFLKYLCLVEAKAILVPEGAVVNEDDFSRFVGRYYADYSRWFSSAVLELTRCAFFKAGALLAEWQNEFVLQASGIESGADKSDYTREVTPV